MMTHGRFLKLFLVTFATVAGMVALINVAVDPKGQFSFEVENMDEGHERESKPLMMKRYPHNAVLLGTSKLAHVNTADVDTAKLKFFNASFSAARPEEMVNFVRANVASTDFLVLSLDLFMMNKSAFARNDQTFSPTPDPNIINRAKGALGYIWSWSTLRESFNQVINGKAIGPIKLLPSGSRDAAALVIRSELMASPDFAKPIYTIEHAAYSNFQYSDERVSDLRELRTLLDQRGTYYVVIISPENEQMLSMIRRTANRQLERFRHDVISIFPNAIDYSESWMSGDKNYFGFDPLHYLPSSGARMVREAIEKTGPEQFRQLNRGIE